MTPSLNFLNWLSHTKPKPDSQNWVPWLPFAAFAGAAILFSPTQTNAQVNSTWTGGAGNSLWLDAANWTNGTPNGAFHAIIDGDNGTDVNVEISASQTVDIERLTVDSGDSVTVLNNANLRINTTANPGSGVIENNGTISFLNQFNNTDFVIDGDATLTGSGTVVLGGLGDTSRIVDESGSDGHLTNESKIAGNGQIGANSLQLTNASNGWIDANVAGRTLTIDTNANGMVNQGTLRSTNGGELVITGATNIDNTGGMIKAAVGSTVELRNDSTIAGGMLDGAGDFEIAASQTVGFSDLTFDGNLNQRNNSNLDLAGNIENTSNNFRVINQFNNTDLRVDSTAQLTGGGTVTLEGSGNTSRIIDESGSDGVLTNVDNTIQGKGEIGVNRLSLVNEADGLVDANDATGTLRLNPNGAGFINRGVFRASNGGTLVLDDGSFDNTNGSIEALANSLVTLDGGTSISNGTLSTSGDGLIEVAPSQSIELADVNLAGQIVSRNNSNIGLAGTINNTGEIRASNAFNNTDIRMSGSVTLQGGGSIKLEGAGDSSRILDESGATGTLTNVDNLIEGHGAIGVDRLAIVNQSTISSNVAGRTLTLDPRDTGAQFTNQGTLQATNGGTLRLSGNDGGEFLNAGGIIEAQDGSTVLLQTGAKISGGTLQTFGTGKFETLASNSNTLEDVSFSGDLLVNNNGNLDLAGTINNTGVIRVNNAFNNTDIRIEGNVTLQGGGTIQLGGAGNTSRILDEQSPPTGVLTNVDNRLSGFGVIGNDRLQVINMTSGTIAADVANRVLTLDTIGNLNSNEGTLLAENGGILNHFDTLENFGIVQSDALSRIEVFGSLRNEVGGRLQGNGIIEAAAISNDGTIAAGASVGSLQLVGNTLLGSTSVLEVELDSSGADFLFIDGDLTLDGDLEIDLLGSYLPSMGDTFQIVRADSISNSFANVMSGDTLATIDGRGTFTVTYGGGGIFLSNFVSTIPEPGSSLVIAALGLTALMRRRRK